MLRILLQCYTLSQLPEEFKIPPGVAPGGILFYRMNLRKELRFFPGSLVVKELHFDHVFEGGAGVEISHLALLFKAGASFQIIVGRFQTENIIFFPHHFPLAHHGQEGGIKVDGKSLGYDRVINFCRSPFLIEGVVEALFRVVCNGRDHLIPGVQTGCSLLVSGRHVGGGDVHQSCLAEQRIAHIHMVEQEERFPGAALVGEGVLDDELVRAIGAFVCTV